MSEYSFIYDALESPKVNGAGAHTIDNNHRAHKKQTPAPDEALVLDYQPDGRKLRITARRDGDVLHVDTIDPASAPQRKRFLKALAEKLPDLDSNEIDQKLLTLATSTSAPAPVGSPAELDISRIVRPELFLTEDVAGITVPVVIDAGGKPVARWQQYLRWSDGRRECRPLPAAIDLADNSRLWIHPTPGEPSMTATSGWSGASRRAWLAGAQAARPADVFKSVCERIAYFVDLPPDVAPGTTATLALWSMLSYAYPAWDAVPYLYIGGPLGSGKSRVFEILSRVVFRPLQSSNLTAPALFRTLHDRSGVLLFDEAERLRQSTPDQQEILSMLLAGYKRGGQATRLEAVGDTFRPVAFDVFGPKAIACIGGLPPALTSRCISVMMFRSAPESAKPQRRIDADPVGWQRLRDDLHVAVLENGAQLLDLPNQSEVCPPGIGGRSYELWQPILALASWIESHGAAGLLRLVQSFALASTDCSRDESTPDSDETLLQLVVEQIRLGLCPTAKDILERAKSVDSSTFDRWTARTVTNRLRNYGVTTRSTHGRRQLAVGSGDDKRDVTIADLERIQRHYQMELGLTAGSAGAQGSAGSAGSAP